MGVEIKGDIDPNVINTFENEPIIKFDENVIKRYKIKYTVPEMVRFGMLPYTALLEYEQYKAAKEADQTEEIKTEEIRSETKDSESKDKPEKEKKVNHTFWEDDDGDRELMSQADFEKFLRENSISL